MHYEGNMIRPPSEANSILLQATVGCSHNKCTFCGAYKGERFKIKSDDIIMEDIAFAAKYCKNQDRSPDAYSKVTMQSKVKRSNYLLSKVE